MELVRSEFIRIWPDLKWIVVNEALIHQAGELVFTHNLKAFDSLHLASALFLKEECRGLKVFFSCFDKSLNRAARKEKFMIHEI